MKYYKIFLVSMSFIAIIFLASCGNIDGTYLQLGVSSDFSASESENGNTASDNTALTPEASEIECSPNELVRVSDYIPDAVINMRYASADNFTKGKIYDFDDAYLRYDTAIKLKMAADLLRQQGYRLLIWDAYRHQSAQFVLYENAPDKSYVAEPNKKSRHSAGDTVDVSLVNSDGSAVEMPTDFDDFSDKADRDYSDVPTLASENSKILENAMRSAGFNGYSEEWWHYTDTNVHDYDDIKYVKPANKSKKTYLADCNEFINLRKSADMDSEIICKIPVNGEMVPFSWIDKFVGVKYDGKIGYVLAEYVK